MVECVYNHGHYEGTVSALPVPCEGWYGQTVTRLTPP